MSAGWRLSLGDVAALVRHRRLIAAPLNDGALLRCGWLDRACAIHGLGEARVVGRHFLKSKTRRGWWCRDEERGDAAPAGGSVADASAAGVSAAEPALFNVSQVIDMSASMMLLLRKGERYDGADGRRRDQADHWADSPC